ncbi:hypothetical protein, partial [Psychroserpens burtonensis]|uniref:hypothetical protein n=1 Tax=Psychroserpens burtonensis TaxID=49278 RepID=UPI0004060356
MLNRIFRKSKKKLSKSEEWKKFELFELFDDLDSALKLVSEYSGGYSGVFLSAEEFHKAFSEELHDLKYQNVPDFKTICVWFAPTSAWDNFVGMEGIELGSRIFERAYKFHNSNN